SETTSPRPAPEGDRVRPHPAALSLALAATLCVPPLHAAGPPPRRNDRHGDTLPHGAVARLGTVRFRVPFPMCVAFSRDGKTLFSGGYGGQVHVLDPATGKELRRFGAHGLSISCLALSPNGRLLATGGEQDKDVCLWDLATGKQVRRCRGHTHPVY